MEQSDIDLLYTVPPYHLQSLAKLRRSKGQSGNTPLLSSSSPIPEIAEYLFHPSTINEAMRSLNDTESLILFELVSCGGRANSRDLALYLTSNYQLSTIYYPLCILSLNAHPAANPDRPAQLGGGCGHGQAYAAGYSHPLSDCPSSWPL